MSDVPVGSAWAELMGAERRNARLGHENLGSLSAASGFVPVHPPRLRLPSSHRAWDELAAQLPQLHTEMAVRTALQRMPLLPAGPAALPDTALLRAATVLGVLGHAYAHMLAAATPDLPASIALPWTEVRRRLGRGPAPVLSYADLIVNNWRTVDSSASPALRVENLRLLVPAVDNQEERVFYLTQLEILARCAPVVANVARAQDAVRTSQWDEAYEALSIIKAILVEVNTKSLRLINPRSVSDTFVNPVVWAKTVAPLAVPLSPGVLGPSGTASPIINLLDAFFGRAEYASQLGQEILAHRRAYPANWQRFIAAVEQTSVHSYLARRPGRQFTDQFEAAREAYAGRDGFLGRHRRKVYGYLAIGFTVGRAVTIGGFSGSPRQRRWDDVDAALTASQTERPPSDGQPQHAPSPARAVERDGRRIDGHEHGSQIRFVDLFEHNDAQHGWWIAIGGRVYDVTAFVRRHPGGAQILQAHAGLDATEAFTRAHRDPSGLGHLKDSLAIGYLERPVRAAPDAAWLDAAYALVELQNAFRLDRSFADGTRLCTPCGLSASAFQLNRATNTFERFRDEYLPEFVSGPLRCFPELLEHHPPFDDPNLAPAPGDPDDGSAEIRQRLDGLEQWMAIVKSELLSGLGRSGRLTGSADRR